MDKLRALRTFAAIAERGSLTAAAKELGRSLPTVVRTLAALEESLGVRLFYRTTRRIALTDEGRIYLSHAQGILQELDRVEDWMAGRRGEASGHVTITAPLCFGERHVGPGLARLAVEHPKLKMTLMLADRVVDLFGEGVDVAVRIAHLDNDASITARPLGAVRQVVCASPAVAAKYRVSRPQDLESVPCLRQDGNDGGRHWPFQVNGRAVSVDVAGNFASNTVTPKIHACAAGAGFGAFLSYQVADWLADGRLVEVLTAHQPPPIPVNLVTPHTRMPTPRVQAVLDGLAREIRKAPFAAAA